MQQQSLPAQLKPTVIVTGGCGFLGSHIVDAFVNLKSYRVVALSRNPTIHCNPGAEYISCDASKREELARIIHSMRPSAIVHKITPGPFAPAYQHHADFRATKDLVNIAEKTDSVRAFVYSGSAEAISNVSGRREQPLTEDEALLHSMKSAPSAYAHAKSRSVEVILGTNGPSLHKAVLHLPAMYGPRDRNVSLNLWKMRGTIMTRVQLGRNDVLHDWLYVENAAIAHRAAVEAALLRRQHKAGPVDGEAFFVTDGFPMRFWDFARKMWLLAGVQHCETPGSVLIIPWRMVLAMATFIEIIFLVFTAGTKTAPLTRLHFHYMKDGAWFNIEKAMRRINYVPSVPTEEGIQRTISWFQRSSVAVQHKRSRWMWLMKGDAD